MKPAWDQLGDQYADSKTVIIADVDCTIEKTLCGKYGVRGYPTIKYFTAATAADGDKYEGGRDFNALKTFVENNLGPSCGPDNLDLCDDKQKAFIEEKAKLSPEERKAMISKLDAELAGYETTFKSEVEKLQKKYESLMKEKEAAEKAFTSANPYLRLLKSIKDTKGGKDEL